MKKSSKSKPAPASRAASLVSKKKPAGKAQAVKSVPKAAARKPEKIANPAAAKPAAKGKPKIVTDAIPKKAAAAKKPVKPAIPKQAQVAQRRKELAHFRELLLRKQQELTQAYKIVKGDSKDSLDNGTEDYIDYAVNSYAREFLLSLTELDRKQLGLVDDALRRIDSGEYGRCQQCGEEINRKRLEVAPWARHCVRCQELEEQGLLPQFPQFGVPEGEEELEDDEATHPEGEFEADAEDAEVDEVVLDEEPLVAEVDDDAEE